MTREDVGSVEDEARRLVDAWTRVRPPGAGRTDPPAADPATDAGERGDDGPPTLRLIQGAADDADEDDSAAPVPCPGCAASKAPDAAGSGGDRPSCPWCRGTAWTLEQAPAVLRSVADVASLVADGLRTLAASIETTGSRADATSAHGAGREAPVDRDDRRGTASQAWPTDRREEQA